jgi:uncharacterized protein (TIGR03437 family)
MVCYAAQQFLMGRSARALLLIFVFHATASAQYTISTFAGTGRTDFTGDGGPATSAGLTISGNAGLALDSAGSLYVADGTGRIRKVDASGTITTVAGGGRQSPAEGVPATSASIYPETVAISGGNLYFTRPTVYRIDAAGVIHTLPNTKINFTGGLAADAAGNVYISDLYDRNWILKITPDGVVSTVAGTGSGGYSGDNGPATAAQLSRPLGLAVGADGSLYIAEYYNNRVRKVDAAGTITTVAGNEKADYLGDGGKATSASLKGPVGVALDGAGNLYITDAGNSVVRKVDTSGIITTIAGIAGRFSESGDGGPALSAQLSGPTGIAVDAAGRIYVGDVGNNRVRVLTPVQVLPATVSTLSPASAALGGAGFTLTVNGSNFLDGATVRWNGSALATNWVSATKLTASVPGSVVAVAGNVSIAVTNPGAVVSNSLGFAVNVPAGVAAGTSYTIATFAGTGRGDFSGDGGPATSAGMPVTGSRGIALDGAGNVYIADGSSRIRKVDASGIITTVAGGGTRDADEGVPALSAGLRAETVALDSAGNLYFTRPTVYRIDTAGVIHNLPNTGINFTGGLATDAAGNLYISDLNDRNWVLKITPAGQVITVAGTGSGGYSGDNGPATAAQLSRPLGVAVGGDGSVYIVDYYNNRVRKVDPSGIITTVAGNGKADYLGDGGAATSASLNGPVGVAVDGAGNLYITDAGNSVIRKVDTAGIITTIAGMAGRFAESGDGGLALNAQLNGAGAIAVDAAGRVYIGDSGNARFRVLTPVQVGPATVTSISPTSAPLGGAGFTLTVTGTNFVSGATVRWNGTALATTAVSASQLTAAVPASVVAVAGGVSISVGNPGAVISNAIGFAVNPTTTAVPATTYKISVFAGTGRTDFSGDGGPATSAGLTISANAGLTLDGAGNLYVADGSRIRKVDTSGTITTVVGGGSRDPDEGIPALSAGIRGETVALDPSGNLFFTRPTVYRVDTSGIIHNLPNTGINFTGGLATDAAGNLYISDLYTANWVLKITPAGQVITVAGTGSGGYSGDNGPAIAAQLSRPLGVAVGGDGSVYIAEYYNNRIRKVNPAGIITTVAGNGKADYLGDGGAATSAALKGPVGVALDSAGNLYITDAGNSVIRKVDTSGIITTIAGIAGRFAESGDGGPALSAQLNGPTGIAVDAAGRIYIGDVGNARVRMLTPSTPTPPPSTAATIASISPASAAAGGAAFTLTVSGSNFVSGAVVRWNGNALATTFVSATQLTAAVPTSLIATAGTGTITVANPGTAASNSVPFTITPPAPAGCAPTGLLVQAVSPQSGFSAVIGQPVNIQVTIADNCGTPVLTGKGSLVVATFSNSDPSIVLTGAGSGKWVATWMPATGSGGVIIEVTAFEALANGVIFGGTVDVSGIIQSSKGPSLAVAPGTLTFSLSQGGQPASQPLTLTSQGSQTSTFSATASTSWLSVNPASGSSSPGAPGVVTITATPGNLLPGTYTGVVAIQSGGALLSPVTVTMTISGAQPILILSQAGLSYRAAQGGGAPLPQDFGILNIGQGVLNWTAQATTLSGNSNWLSISPASGTVNRPYLDVSLVNVAVDPAGLTAGTYYGQIKVSASGVSNSPQSISVVLTILAPGTNPGPEVRPTGLIFAGPQSPNPAAQGVTIGNTRSDPATFGSAPVTGPGVGVWFAYTPSSSSVVAGKGVAVSVQPDFSRLAPGATRGEIALLFDDGSSANVALLAVVPPPGTSGAEQGRLAPRATGCTPNQLNIQPSGPPVNTTLGQPVTLEVRIVDSCAVALTNATQGAAVRVSFSNGDPPTGMTHVGNGRWSTTWQPQRSSASGTYVATVTAFEGLPNGTIFGNQIDIPVTINGQGDVPIVKSGAVNAASFASDTPVAPGGLVTIFGDKLAPDATSVTGQQPFPAQLGGTQVLLGGVALPLLFASDKQINAQAPFDLPLNVPTQLLVQRGTAISVPKTVSVAPAQPAIFTRDQSGSGQGAIVNGVTNQLADSSAPVTAGDTVTIYCTGLGAVNPAVPTGAAATGPVSTVQPVTVQIGGQSASVIYAGLAPGYPGLYQVNAVVPAGITPGGQVPVMVSTAGLSSPTVTMAVR